MIGRRQLLGTSVVGGLIGALAPAESAEAQNAPTERDLQAISQAIGQGLADLKRSIDRAIDAPNTFAEITGLRRQQTDFLRSAGKLPDFIEVGTDVWWGVYDWHVRHLQPLVVGRDPSGRYTIVFAYTMVIMRADTTPNFVGLPYDNR